MVYGVIKVLSLKLKKIERRLYYLLNTLTVLWSFLMPLIVSILLTYLFSKTLFEIDKRKKKQIVSAGDIILSDAELEMKKDGAVAKFISNILPKIKKYIDIDKFFINEIRKILLLMGEKNKSAERVFIGFIAQNLVNTLPILILPVITQFPAYVIAYPIAVIMMLFQRMNGLKKQYKKWQIEVSKDLPELIDKLRISFASGRDYISAFRQAQKNSGPTLKILLDKLINDFQAMRPGQALNEFSSAFKMPIMNKFTTAVKIAIENGYDQAETYFQAIEADIIELRRVAIEEITKSKPEKVYQLYIIAASMAIGALALKGWEIIQSASKVF